MGLISPTTPTIGQARGDGEVAVRNDLIALLNEFNGNISAANLAAGTLLDTSAVPVIGPERVASSGNVGAGSNVYVVNGTVVGSASNAALAAFRLPVLPAVSGKSARLRLSYAFYETGAGGGPGATITPKLVAVTSMATGVITAGATVDSVTPIVSPTTDQIVQGETAGVAHPGAGLYAFRVDVTGAGSNGFTIAMHTEAFYA